MLFALLGLPDGPAVLDDLGGASHRERSRGDVLRDRRARADVRTLADGDRRHQARVGPDESAVVDLRFVLGDAIIVAGDRPGADVDVLTDRGIADVGEMRYLRPPPNPRLFQLDEVADSRVR